VQLNGFCGLDKRGCPCRLENFIFDSEAADSNLKLIDFGLSKKYGSGIRRMQTMVGTPYYMAPEVAAEAGAYSEACDVWSIGVITYMLLTGTPPFRGDNDHAVLAAVKAAKFSMTGPRWEHISDQAKDFVSCLLRKNPKHRLTAEQALKHDFLKSTEEAIQTMKMSSSVIDSLKRFQHYSTMKVRHVTTWYRPCVCVCGSRLTSVQKKQKVALEAIAFSMNAAQVQEMRRAFVKIDKVCIARSLVCGWAV
jgi:calcium-dependent protein kinase